MAYQRTSGTINVTTAAYNPALSTWATALQNRGTAPAKALVIGDSWAEGQGVTAYGGGAIERLQAALNAKLGATNTATFVPMWGTVPYTWPVVVGAGVGKDNTFGFSQKAGVLGSGRGAAPQATFTFTLTQSGTVRLEWGEYGGSGPVTVTIDGTLVNTQATAGSVYLNTWTSATLAAGSHTVLLTGTGADAYVTGLTVFNGAATSGVQFVNGGHGGWKTSNWSATASTWTPKVTAEQPHLVVIGLGLNDYLTSVASATTKTNLQTIITSVRGACSTDPSIVLWNFPAAGPGTFAEPFRNYRKVIREVAAADAGIFLYDIGSRLPSPIADNSAAYFAGDQLHPTDKGAAVIASDLLGILT